MGAPQTRVAREGFTEGEDGAVMQGSGDQIEA